MSTPLEFFGFTLPPPPAALRHEMEQRVVLLLNHVLQQEPQAMQRLQRQAGRVVRLEFAPLHMSWCITPAGLLQSAAVDAQADLVLTVQRERPLALALAQVLLRGDKPPMQISGDVMLAAEVNWLVDHVRWDVEEDLARMIGDVPAYSVVQALRGLADALKRFIAFAQASRANGSAS